MNKQTQERATRRAESRRKKIERNSAIYDAYTRAGSLRLVAAEFGVTREAVRQAVVCEKRRRMKEDKPVENVSKTSDRVEVVRCRDCKHYEVKDYFIENTPILAASDVPTCHKWSNGCLTNPNGYCHLGERREDA